MAKFLLEVTLPSGEVPIVGMAFAPDAGLRELLLQLPIAVHQLGEPLA